MAKKVSSTRNSFIPDNILFSILSKLSVKSLKRFSCVQKSWSLLFQNTNFSNMFRNNLISKSHPLYEDSCLILTQMIDPYNWNVYLLSGDKFENKVKLQFPSSIHITQFDFAPTRVLGFAINDILCIPSCHPKNGILLWNPATDDVRLTPLGFAEFNRQFNTNINYHGFGYDHVGDDYKIIQYVNYFYYRPRYNQTLLDPFWEIYSVKSNSWRKIEFDMPTMNWSYNREVYFNGVCHWLAAKSLVSFNLCNEKYFITPSPIEGKHYDPDVVSLSMLNGCVAITTNFKKCMSFQISILGEIGVKESWIRLYDVEPLSNITHPIGTGKKGDIFFLRIKDNVLGCFDLNAGLIKEIDLEGSKFWCQVVVYKRNLISFAAYV